MVVEIFSSGNFSMSGTFAFLSANPVTNKRKGLSLSGRLKILFKNLIGLGVCVNVDSPALCNAVMRIPVAMPTDSVA